MKLIELKVAKAFGYLPINVVFHEDITFLVGPNGSGKTTALRLIHAILGPAFEDLYSIAFDTATLTIHDGQSKRDVTINRKKEIAIRIEGIEPPLILPEIDLDQLESIRSSAPRSDAIMEVLRPALLGAPVFEYLQKQTSPLFLGLDRRLLNADLDEDRELVRSKHFLMSTRADRRPLRGSLSNSLYDVQAFTQEAYRRFRRQQEAMTSKLRRAVLLSAFRYTEISDFSRTLAVDPVALLERREEIAHALENLGISGPEVSKQLNEFFNRLEHLFKTKDAEGGMEIELLTNKAQIERIEELIKLIDEHKSSTESAYTQIQRFIDTINAFFSDTRKEIDVDHVGSLKVVRPDKVRVGVDALSSGERQLLVIFGHLFFNRYGARSNIFIIDEPELSLHLRWQEMFVSKALGASPSAQLVLATHSPEMVGRYKDKAVNLGVK